MQEENFETQEAILAFSLDKADCEFLDRNQPCANIFDADILAKLGYRGKPLWESAQDAWKNKSKGCVKYIFKQTPRLLELVRAYRDQEAELLKDGGNSTLISLDIIRRLNAGTMQQDEALVRLACVDLKTRIDFVNIWKKMVPILTFPNVGKTRRFEGTTISQGKSVKADIVERPGFKFISLNAGEEMKRKMGL